MKACNIASQQNQRKEKKSQRSLINITTSVQLSLLLFTLYRKGYNHNLCTTLSSPIYSLQKGLQSQPVYNSLFSYLLFTERVTITTSVQLSLLLFTLYRKVYNSLFSYLLFTERVTITTSVQLSLLLFTLYRKGYNHNLSTTLSSPIHSLQIGLQSQPVYNLKACNIASQQNQRKEKKSQRSLINID